MDDADHGGQLALNPSGALARAQRLETVVIRHWKVNRGSPGPASKAVRRAEARWGA
jgi:hypothetical protein